MSDSYKHLKKSHLVELPSQSRWVMVHNQQSPSPWESTADRNLLFILIGSSRMSTG